MKPRIGIPMAAVMLIAFAAPAVAADPPAWLQDVARSAESQATARAGAGAIVLLDQETVSVIDVSRIVRRRRYAVRILTPNGAPAATHREVYTSDAGEVRSIRGWLIGPGYTTELGKGDIADVALSADDVYNESRARVMSATSRVEPGVVFGAESEVTERVPFPQLEWLLQDRWPVRTVRRTLELPTSWQARHVTLNGTALEPQRIGNTLTWSLSELPAVPDEPAGPAFTSLSRRIAVTYSAPAEAAGFNDWTAVSRWLASLAEPRGVATPALTAWARQLVGSAATDIEKVRTLAKYVQQVQYISIQLGIGRGGGYTPRSASDVFTRNYGDCKDKANLLRTALAAVGIRSYLVTLFSGDADYVRAEWPSPQQFNHVILAIAIETTSSAAIRDERLGSLLLFDPTDDETPLGELPASDQGGRGLIVTAEGGSLIALPEAPPEANRRERTIDATLATDGSLIAQLRQSSIGAPAAAERQWLRAMTREEYLSALQADARRQIPGATVTLGEATPDHERNQFQLAVTIRAAAYAQVVQNRLLIVRPPRALRSTLPSLPTGGRESSIVLDARDEIDTFELTLPPGVAVDELPEPAGMTTAFGRFRVEWTTTSGRIVRRQTLRIERRALPATAYGDVRAFLEAFRAAEDAPAILSR